MRFLFLAVGVITSGFHGVAAYADVTVFFDSSQTAVDVASGTTSDTISSNGYLFTYTRDKLFTGGVGMPDPVGRAVRVPWPEGVEAQAVTVPPPGVTDYKARITLSRVDSDVFDLNAFSFQLLGNTYGAGATIEIMPLVDGEDALNDPVFFDANGYYGQVFSYNEQSPSYLGNTSSLKGYDTYKIGLYVDFALKGLTLEGTPVPEPSTLMLLGCVVATLACCRRRWLSH